MKKGQYLKKKGHLSKFYQINKKPHHVTFKPSSAGQSPGVKETVN